MRRQRLYPVAMLAVGGAVQAAQIGLTEPCFVVLEGGYNHDVLGQNVLALMQGMAA